jgi:hypothetical protein
MLSLSEGKHAVEICTLVTGKKKQPVYYIDTEDKARLNKTDTKTLLGGHLPRLKTNLRITEDHLGTALNLLHNGQDPSDDDHKHVHKGFWKLRELRHELLTREMDIRSERDQSFRIDFPKKKDEFFGHVACLGATGAGKGWFITSMILRHWKSTSYLHRRHVFYISAEASIDKTLDRLRIRKFEEWFHPVDVSYEAGENSGLNPEQFWVEKVESQLAEVRNCIVVLDDVQDSYGLASSVLQTQNRMLRIGRHRNISVISVFHSIKNGQWTRQLIQSAKYLILFPKAQQGRTRDFFYEALGMPRREALELTKFIQKCGRACIVRTSAPVSVICEKYLKLI